MSRLSEISFEPLEPYDGKLSCTVLRGERGSNAPDLPDIRLRSSSIRATSIRHSILTVTKPAAFALCTIWFRLFAMPHS